MPANISSERRPPTSTAIPRSAWTAWRSCNLERELFTTVPTVRDPPPWFRGSLRRAYAVALREWRDRKSAESWKLLLLIPRMLLRPTAVAGSEGKRIFSARMDRFERGEWEGLLRETRGETNLKDAPRKRDELQEAVAMVRIGELSRARMFLTSAGLAPGNNDTLAELRDPALRPRELTRPLPDALADFVPDEQVDLDQSRVLQALRSAGRGSAADLSGSRYEHYRVLMEDDELWPLFAQLCNALAKADVPEEIAAAISLGRMTALKKTSGKVRGIVAGCTLRRLVGRALATQFSEQLMKATAPFQYALQTRAGTGALGHALQALADHDPDLVVLSLDGVGAFDHVQRAAMFDQLLSVPALHALVPAVRLFYGRTSRFLWTDDKGETHTILQGEGASRAIL